MGTVVTPIPLPSPFGPGFITTSGAVGVCIRGVPVVLTGGFCEGLANVPKGIREGTYATST